MEYLPTANITTFINLVVFYFVMRATVSNTIYNQYTNNTSITLLVTLTQKVI